MQYFGGKAKVAKQIAAYVQPFVDERGAYVEPFVGGANVLQHIRCEKRVAYDANEALITLWKAVCGGWEPPSSLTKDEYANIARAKDPKDPLTAFAGFGCSFAGKWFGGYASYGSRNYASSARESLLKKRTGVIGTLWSCADYRDAAYYDKAVVYCDPPYAGTTQYGAVCSFDTDAFWSFIRELEADGMCVFVSEYTAPEDFETVLEIPTRLGIRNKDGERERRVEKLFRFRG